LLQPFTWDVGAGLPLLLQDRVASYIYGPGGQILEQVQGTSAYYYHADQLASVRALTDQSKAVVATYTYDAYGQPVSSTGSVANPFRYAGEYQDAESGLYYLRARYYDPTTQQFLTVDPLLAATEQAYNYAAGSPLNATDPSGMSWYLTPDQSAAMQRGLGAAADLLEQEAWRYALGGLPGGFAGGLGWAAKKGAGQLGSEYVAQAAARLSDFVEAIGIATAAEFSAGSLIAFYATASQLRGLDALLKQNTDPCFGVAMGWKNGPIFAELDFLNRGTGQAQAWYPPIVWNWNILHILPESMKLGTAHTFGGAPITRSSGGYAFTADFPSIP
jgi:RHS repeat-associated protein